MSFAKAKKVGLLKDDDETVMMKVGSATKVATEKEEVRIGRVKVLIRELREEPFVWPVMFYRDWPEGRMVLGLAGVTDDLTVLFDGTPHEMSEFGTVTFALRPKPVGG